MGVSGDHAEWLARVLQTPGRSDWVLQQDRYVAALEHEVESRLALGNGFLGVRASLDLPTAASDTRTLLAGLFDPQGDHHKVPSIVPIPNWLRLGLDAAGRPLSIEDGETLDLKRVLDLPRGILVIDWRQRTATGPTIRLRSLRFVSLAARAVGVQFVRIEVDQALEIQLEAWVEPEARRLLMSQITRDLSVWRLARSRSVVAIGSSAVLRVGDRPLPPEPGNQQRWTWRLQAQPGEPLDLSRTVGVAWSRTGGDVAGAASRVLRRVKRGGDRELYASHVKEWQKRWTASDVVVETSDGSEAAQRALRFATYHLNSAANPESSHTSIGARALTGDGYLGHVFWDTEIFLLPFYTLTWPAAARAMLEYRYHTLPGARAKAKALGYRGAVYAWESADTGEETTPSQVIGPAGEVLPIVSGTEEHHISAAVAYAVWQYWHATGDYEFLRDFGAEIVLETARFWASRVIEKDGGYHICQVMGPDEYHESVNDNAYTNHMARWNIERGLDAIRLLQRRWPERWLSLQRRLRLTERELRRWREVAAGMFVAFDDRTGLLEQFEGYFDLEQIDLTEYAPRTVPMDLVLGATRTASSQVIKQADVLMLLALLGDTYSSTVWDANFDYYEPRCGHGSSLSPPVHALVAARMGRTEQAERYFEQTAAIDLDNAMGNSAAGVHIGALGGLWQAAVCGFGGTRLGRDVLRFEPHLPASWRALAFPLQWRGRRLRIEIRHDTRTFAATLERGRPLTIEFGDRPYRLVAGETWTTPLEILAERG